MAVCLNILGFILVISGAVISYFNSPTNNGTIDGGDAATDFNNEERKIARKNRLLLLGFCNDSNRNSPPVHKWIY